MMRKLLSIGLLIPFVAAAHHSRGLVSSGYNTRATESDLLSPEMAIVIRAGDFIVPDGVVVDDSSEGTQNLAKIITGHKLSFYVNLEVGGLFRLQARISNADNVGSFFVVDSETKEIYGQVDVLPPTGTWEQWATVRVGDAHITAGTHVLEILVLDGGFNLGWISLTLLEKDTLNITNGHDATPNSFMVAATDFEWAEGMTVDPINGNLGETSSGDYVKYEINIPVLGVYAIHVRVSSLYGQGSFIAKNSATQQIYGRVDSIPETGGWHKWTTVSVNNITFEPGVVPFEILVIEGGWNMMHFTVERTSPIAVDATNATNSTIDVNILVPSASVNSSAGVEVEAPQIIGNISNTAFKRYNLDVPLAGNYQLDLEVASMNGAGSFLVTNSETQEIYGSVDSIPATGGWGTYTTVSVNDIDLEQGTVPLEIMVMEGSFNLLFMALKLNEIANQSSSSNISDTASGNSTSGNHMILATDNVGSDGVVTEAPFNGTETIGSINTGDTIDYDITVPSAGNYRLDLAIASLLPEGAFMVINRETQEVYGQLDSVPATGDWYKWEKVSVGSIDLPAGTVPLRVVAIVGGWHLMWLSLEPISDSNQTAVADSNQAFSSSNQSSVADSNQTSVAASIKTVKFFYPASIYDSMKGIELEPSSEGGENVGSIEAGDWVAYQVNLPSSGKYKAEMRVASHMGLGSFEFVDGRTQNVYGTVNVPITGWWQIYTTISDELTLPGGSYPLQIRALEAGWNFLWFSLEMTGESL